MPLSRPRLVRTGLSVASGIVIVVFGAVWLRSLPAIQQFISVYPGGTALNESAPVGIPAWLAWQHFFNAFFLVLIIRTGWIIRSKQRPPAFWTRNDAPIVRLTGRKQRLGIYHWLHLSVDAFWVLNGGVFLVLLFATGQWKRVVPTSWDIIPNALSTALQYASLDWPTENAWVSYNALQVLSYFTVVFVLAPLAIITGLRLSPAWPLDGPLARILPEAATRRLHGVVLYLFSLFIVIHVAIVLLTGARRNLNIMYAGNDSESWIGVGIFALSIAIIVIAWILVTPKLLKRLAALSGDVR